jgi:hypothetical protein
LNSKIINIKKKLEYYQGKSIHKKKDNVNDSKAKETHVWHAKRVNMVDLFGWRLPIKDNETALSK